MISLLLSATIMLHRVHDGDSVRLYLDGAKKSTPIRMKCIDAPELRQKHGKNSREALKRHFRSNGVITVKEYGQDRYGRVIAEVFVDGNNVNLSMVESGNAYVYEEYCKDAVYRTKERQAKHLKRGVWRDPGAIEPKAWRKEQKRKRSK